MNQFQQPTAQVYIPDGVEVEQAFQRITHLGIGAHPDDLEIMAITPIGECFDRTDLWFGAVVVTDGGGAPRADKYARLSNTELREVRITEQRQAAKMGRYGVLVMLDHTSEAVREQTNEVVIKDLVCLLEATSPRVVFTHNLADRHATHVAVALRTLSAIRALPMDQRPQRLIGGEAWRGLDWLPDAGRVVEDVTQYGGLQERLIGCFRSQLGSGKRYDLAVRGRQRANATFWDAYQPDQAEESSIGMDMTPLIREDALEPGDFVKGMLELFVGEVEGRVRL